MSDRCTEAVALATGLLDGSAADIRHAKAHVATCADCAGLLGLQPASAKLVKQRQSTRQIVVRVLLAIASLIQAAIAIPWLTGSNLFHIVDGTVSSDHLTRDGALGVAVALLGGLAAWRPRWSAPLCGTSFVLVAIQTIVGALDKSEGKVGLDFEMTHLLAFAIVGLLTASAALARVRVNVQRTPQLWSVDD